MTDRSLTATRACVFDAYGTLFDVASAARACVDVLGDKAEALTAQWRTSQLQYTWLRSLMGMHADFWQITGEALDYAMDIVGVSSGSLRRRLMDLYLVLTAYPDAKAGLKVLHRSERPMAILSNGSPKMLAAAVRSAELSTILDHVLSVEEVGVYKPHPRVYRLAVDRLHVSAEHVCFISSNGRDVAGGSAFGMKAVWVNRSGLKGERLPTGPVATIKRIDELPALLGA